MHSAKYFCTEYEKSKAVSDQIALEAAKEGVPIVAVYPGVIYGPGKVTSGNMVARMIVERFNGRLPGYVGDGNDKFSFSHVDDVVDGHISALDKGQIGERYLLTGENASFMQVFDIAASITNTNKPWFNIPLFVINVYGWLSVLFSRITAKLPLISPPAVDVLRHQWAYSCEKAKRELNYKPRSLTEGLEEYLLYLNLIGMRLMIQIGKMLFRHKYLADGTLGRYKARLVANGSTQLEGVDVDETFSLLDVKNAFLHGDLSETVYMHQPPRHGMDTAYFLLYVDDIVLTASSPALLQRIITFLHQEFSMMDLGSLNYFLGISDTRDSSGIRTPIDTESKMGIDGDPVSDPTLYRSLVGSLQYLTFTRPDISYAVQQVCLYMHDPRESYFLALNRILRYVRGTLDYGLHLFSSSATNLVAYSDADWVGCTTTRRSTLGYCVYLGNNLLSWSSKRQPTLSRSSAEAEYRGVANVVAETCWLHNLLDPSSSCSFSLLDIFTKGLLSALFEEFRISLSVRCPPALTVKEC
nr:NAD-dependent epimerase/dehydratase [Tanacetum cinerariifolium]